MSTTACMPCAGLPTGTTPTPHGKSITASMKQLHIGSQPKPLRSGALAGPAASGAPNQQQAAQQRGGDGMDFDDARSEISFPESHPDSESSASSFSGNRAAPLHATSIGSSRPCQPPKRSGRQAGTRVGGKDQVEIDRLLTQIVEKQRNEMPDEVGVSWAETAEKLNECDYIREHKLSKTPKYCRDRCDPLYVSRDPPGAASPRPPPFRAAPRTLPQRYSALFHRHIPSAAVPFVAPTVANLRLAYTSRPLTLHDAPHRARAHHTLTTD